MEETVAVVHNKDFAASLLRSQISTLVDVLKEIESNSADSNYISTHLKRVEKNINWLRNFNFST